MKTLRDRCSKRLEGLKSVRKDYEADWRETARLAQPARSRFLSSDKDKNLRRARNASLFDEHGLFASRTLANGMTSGLSSQSRPWFQLSTYDDALTEQPDVKAWLDDVEKRLYSFFASTNFYGASKTGYLELGLFGTEACVMAEHDQAGAVCHSLTAGEYWIATSTALVADTLYRRVPMSVRQTVDTFGKAVSQRVQRLYDTSNYDEVVNVFHAIEPRADRDTAKIDGRNKPWASVWWDEDDGNCHTVLREGGYDEQPFWAPRWDTTGSDTYGYSPGMEALPSLRELQMQSKRRNEAIDHLIKPELITPAGMKITRQPGNVVSASSVDAAGVQPSFVPDYRVVQAVSEEINKSKEAIDRLFYADLFMAITNMQGIQPRNMEEIASRNEEKLTQIGPVIERVNTEKLEVAIDRAFAIMQRKGLLQPPPDALEGKDLKINFVSILTQMQRMVGIGQIERTAGFVGNLAGVFPEAVDKINVDEMIDEYAERAGAPARLIRSSDEVAKIREQRAQQQAMQQAAANAPAVRDGAEAARLLSETDTGSGSLLEAFAG